jgi:hypothetical protein
MGRWRWFARAGLLAAIVVAACGGDDDTPAARPSSDGTESAATATAGRKDSGGVPGGSTTTSDGRVFVADIGFRPTTNDYSFENFARDYPNTAPTLTVTELRRMFGDAAVCVGGGQGSSCKLAPAAAQWMDARNVSMNGGHCEGFAVTALRFYAGVGEQPGQFGAESVHALKLEGNDPLLHHIAYFMATQWAQEVASITQEYQKLTPKEVLAELVKAMQGKDWMTLGIYARQGGGHAITPYAVEDKGDGKYWILIYDNNYPNEERYVEVDTVANTWVYAGAATNPDSRERGWEGDASTFSLDLTPLSVRELQYTCPWCGAQAGGADKGQKKSVVFTGDGNVTVADKQGRKMVFQAGRLVKNEIPGALLGESRSRKDTMSDPPVLTLLLPEHEDFAMTIDGNGLKAGDASASKERLYVFGQGKALAVKDFNVDPGETSVVKLGGEGGKFSFKAGGDEHPKVSMALDPVKGDDMEFELSGLDFSNDEEMDFSIDETTGKLSVKDTGGIGHDKFNLKVVRETAAGQQVVEKNDLDLGSNGTDTIDYDKLDEGGDLSIAEDEDSDGTPESTSTGSGRQTAGDQSHQPDAGPAPDAADGMDDETD